MIERFREATILLGRNIKLFSAIILTIWLPANIIINFIYYNIEGISELTMLRLPMLIEGFLGPIYIGALIYSLFQIKSGHTITYKEAMKIGLKKWDILFGARFVAGILIVLGIIALVIPGIILLVRYTLLDAAVVIEDKRVTQSRARSIELTKGRRWPIFWSGLIFFILFIIFSITIYLPLDFIELLNNMYVEIILDCILDIIFSILQIVIFLFYWESIMEQRDAEQQHLQGPGDENAAWPVMHSVSSIEWQCSLNILLIKYRKGL